MFRGLKSKLEKSLNQSGIITSLSKGNLNDDLNGNTPRNHQQGDDTPMGGSKLSSASTSLVDLNEDPANQMMSESRPYLFHQSTSILSEGDVVDYMSPALLDLSNYESIEDLNNSISSKLQRPTPQRMESNMNNNATQIGRSRNSSVSSQMSDSYYFTSNSGFVPQPHLSALQQQQPPMSDVESVASELEDNSSVASSRVVDDRMMELVSREELMRFYKKMQLKNQKYTGRYSQVVAAYKELEKERNQLKEVLTKCQDKSFRRINELKEQLGLKNMALNDVDVNYTMMLQEKQEVIKVLQMQVNILKQKFESDKLIEVEEKNEDTSVILEENLLLKDKISKMSGLLSNCKGSILKHRDEIKELQSQNSQLERKTTEDQEELDSLRSKVDELVSEMKSRLEKQDSNNLRLVQDFSLLQAEHEAMTRLAENKEDNASNLSTDLQENLKLLTFENVELKKKIDELSRKLKEEIDSNRTSDKIHSEKEILAVQWRERIIGIIGQNNNCSDARNPLLAGGCESDDAQDSSRSEVGSNSWITTDTDQDESSAGKVSSSSSGIQFVLEDENDAWKEVETKLMNFLEEKQTNPVQRRCRNSIGKNIGEKGSLSIVCSPAENASIAELKSVMEKSNKEKLALKKSLAASKMQARVFRNLCECIFKAVVSKRKLDSQTDVSNPCDAGSCNAADLNANFNNNVPASDSSESAAQSTASGDGSFAENSFTCIPDGRDPLNPLKVTRSEEEYSDRGFSVRQSILSILKDGLGQTMKMMEERKIKKRRPEEMENFYRLSTADDEENANENKNANNFEEAMESMSCSSQDEESCLEVEKQPSCSIPAQISLDTICEDDEEWETVDEEEDNEDGSVGYIDDYETLFLGNGQSRNSSIQKLLLDWKTGCEKIEQTISPLDDSFVSERLCQSFNSEGRSLREGLTDAHQSLVVDYNQLKADHQSLVVDYNQVKSDHQSLVVDYNQLKADHESLAVDYNQLKSDFQINLQSLDELKEKNESTSEAFENLRTELKQKTEDNRIKEDFLENAQNGNSQLQNSLDVLMQDYLKIQQQVKDSVSDNVRLTTEISESNEHFEQLRHDLSSSEVKCSQLMEELHRNQLDQNITRQDYAELKDEHEKLQDESLVLKDSLKKTKDNLLKLQGEHQLLREDHKNLIEECNQMKLSQSDLIKDVESLRSSRAEVEENRDKLQTSLDKSRQETSALSIEFVEHKKQHDKLLDDFKNCDDVCELLKTERERLLKDEEELRIELSNLVTKNSNLGDEANSLRQELEKLKESSSESILSDLQKTKDELAVVREEFDKVQIQLEFMKGNLDKSMDENSILEDKLQEINEVKDDLVDQSSRFETELKEKDNEIEKSKMILTNLEGMMESSSSEMSMKHEAMEKIHQSKIDGFKEQLQKSDSNIRDLQILLQDVNDEKVKLKIESESLTLKIQSLESVCRALEEKNTLLLSDVESLTTNNERKLMECENKYSKDFQILRENLATCENEIKELKQKLKSIQNDHEEQLEKNKEIENKLIKMAEEVKIKDDELNLLKKLHEDEKIKHNKLDADLQQQLTSLQQENLTNEKQVGHFKQQLDESQQQIDFLKIANENLEKTLKELIILNETKSLEFIKEFQLKNQAASESWKDELAKLEDTKTKELEELRKDMESKRDVECSSREKLEQENAILVNEIEILNERMKQFVTEFEKLRLENNEMMISKSTLDSRVLELEMNLLEEKNSFKEKEATLEGQIDDSTSEIARLKLSSMEATQDVDELRQEVLTNLKIMNEIRLEKDEIEKSLEDLKEEKNNLEAEGIHLKEQLKKVEENFNLLKSSHSSDRETLELKLLDVISERNKLKNEVENFAKDHLIILKDKDHLIDKLESEKLETFSKLEKLSLEKVSLEISLEEQKVKVLKLEEEIHKLSITNVHVTSEFEATKINLTKSLEEAEQRLKESKESSEAKIKVARSEMDRLVQEEKERSEKEMSNLREDIHLKDMKELEEVLRNKESEWTNKMNDLKKKAEMKFKQIKKQKDDAILSHDEQIHLLQKEISQLKEDLLQKDAEVENTKISSLEDVRHLKDLLAQETSKLSSQINHSLQLESSLAENKISLEQVQLCLDDYKSRLQDTQAHLDDYKSRLEDSQSQLSHKTNALVASSEEIEKLKEEIIELKNEYSILKTNEEDLSRKLQDTTNRLMQLEILSKTSEEEKSSKDVGIIDSDKLESLEKKLAEVESESETVKRKNQSLRQEVRRLRTENETNVKAAELEKNFEIERLKREYLEEMNEREEDSDSKIKHLLKEFQVKMAEKEKEYQEQFVSSMEKLENENELRVLDMETEVRELEEELQDKEDVIDERCAKIEELMLQIERMKSAEEWEELMKLNKQLESENQELRQNQDEGMDVEDECVARSEDKPQQLNGSQLSLVSNATSVVEFEYLKTIVFKYMIGSADRQTLTRVICKIMNYSDEEERRLMEPWRK